MLIDLQDGQSDLSLSGSQVTGHHTCVALVSTRHTIKATGRVLGSVGVG